MIITRMRWADVPDGALVVGPSGRIYRLVGKRADQYNRPYVALSDPEHDADGDFIAATPYVDPNAETDVIVTDSPLENAADILSRFFPLERIRS